MNLRTALHLPEMTMTSEATVQLIYLKNPARARVYL